MNSLTHFITHLALFLKLFHLTVLRAITIPLAAVGRSGSASTSRSDPPSGR